LKEATHVKTRPFPTTKLKEVQRTLFDSVAKVWQERQGEVSINNGNISHNPVNDNHGGTVHKMILTLEKTSTRARQARNESHSLSITVHEKSPVERLSPPRH